MDLYFMTGEGRHLAHDIRSAGVGQTTWDFVVCTDIPDSEVQVRLSDLSGVPHDLTVLLTDLDAQRTVYARTVPLYMFHTGAEGVTLRHFRLQVRPKSDAGLVISSAAVHPAPAGQPGHASSLSGERVEHLANFASFNLPILPLFLEFPLCPG